FQNSGELAIQMCVFFPIAYVAATKLKPYVSKRIFYILALMPVTAAMTILGSSSRGGQLALLVQIFLIFNRQIFKPRILIVLVVIGASLFALLPEEQKERFSSAGEDRTSQQRLNYWERGLEMLNERPLLGIGYFNFPSYFERYHSDAMLYPRAELPHNIFVQVGAELGYSGLAVYLVLIFHCIVRRFRAGDDVAPPPRQDLVAALPLAFNLSFLGFLAAGQFVSVVYYPFMWISLAFAVCIRRT